MPQATTSLVLAATLRDQAGNPIPGKSVTFSYMLPTGPMNAGPTQTGPDGVASVTVTIGEMTAGFQVLFTATFAGDAADGPSSASRSYYIPPAPPPPPPPPPQQNSPVLPLVVLGIGIGILVLT